MGGLRQRICNAYRRGHEEKYNQLPSEADRAWQSTLEAIEPVIADLLKRDNIPEERVDDALDRIMRAYFKSTDNKVVNASHAFSLLPYHLTESVQRARGARP